MLEYNMLEYKKITKNKKTLVIDTYDDDKVLGQVIDNVLYSINGQTVLGIDRYIGQEAKCRLLFDGEVMQLYCYGEFIQSVLCINRTPFCCAFLRNQVQTSHVGIAKCTGNKSDEKSQVIEQEWDTTPSRMVQSRHAHHTKQ